MATSTKQPYTICDEKIAEYRGRTLRMPDPVPKRTKEAAGSYIINLSQRVECKIIKVDLRSDSKQRFIGTSQLRRYRMVQPVPGFRRDMI